MPNRNKPVNTGTLSNTWNYIRLNRHALLFSFIFFVFFPFLYSNSTYDPELHLRYFALSVVLLPAAIYFVIPDKKKESPYFAADKSFRCFILFFLFSLLSVAWSVNPGDAFYEASKIFLLLVCFCYFIYAFRQSPDAITVFSVAVAIAVIIFTLILILTTAPLLMDAITGASTATGRIRLVSSFANKNFYAETIFLCLPFAIYGSLFFRKATRILCMVALFFITAPIIIIASISVWIATMAFVATMVICMVRYNRKAQQQASYRTVFFTMAIMLAGLLVAVVSVSKVPALNYFFKPVISKIKTTEHYLRNGDRIFADDPSNANSLFERILLARNSIQLFEEHPVTGCGLAGWKIFFPKFGITGTSYLNQGHLRFEHPHNDYLLVLSEEGIVGLLLWLGIFVFSFINIFRLMKESTERKTVFLLSLLCSGAIGFLTLSLSGYPKERLYSMVMLLLILAIPAAMSWKKTNIPKRYGRRVSVVVALLCIVTAYIQLKKLRGEIHMHKAITYQKQKNLVAMRNEVMKARSFFYPVDATSTPLNWYLGLTSYYAGDTAAAFNYYKQALDQNPYHVQVLNDLGTMYEKKGNTAMAIDLYKTTLMISPANANAVLNLTVAYYHAGDFGNALSTLKKNPEKNIRIYKKELQAILVAQANKYVREAGDTALADYLSAQLNANENYLLNMYAASPDSNVHFKAISDSLRKKSPL